MQLVSSAKVASFQKTIWDYYAIHRRDLPWRRPNTDGTFDPYHILVSEMMLQQTQVSRVIPKHQAFLNAFPTLESLAASSLPTVLGMWSGLGYNRRAKYLLEATKVIAAEHAGAFPVRKEQLVTLPGIGPNTAAAILVYSFNQPLVFIETNIRSVYLHHFFSGESAVSDRQLMPLIEQTLPMDTPREWYWALMDYGTYLKTTQPNPSRASRHHSKQSRFEGSRRQIRGLVLKQLLRGSATEKALHELVADSRLEEVLNQLAKEGLITKKHRTYHLGK